MQHFYDGQIRRYITQTIRVFSNFVVKYGDGTLHRIPVMYGDADRQVASIMRGNSENKVSSVPRIAVYVSALDMDRERLSDASFVGKLHIRERDTQIDPVTGRSTYNENQGRNYTVERLMPTPYKLTMKVDIWTANTDQKLQIMEQILVLFNPSLELQTTDNFVDWTALTVLNLSSINWSSKTVPVGTDTPIDVGTLTVETPIWISPPAKVKHLGVITKIITSLWGSASNSATGYIEGLGTDLAEPGSATFSDLLATDAVTISGFGLTVYNGQAELIPGASINLSGNKIADNWQAVFDQYPGKYIAGSSQLFVTQPDGVEVSGTIAINEFDNSLLTVNWDQDTYPRDDLLESNIYSGYVSLRTGSLGTFDAIIDPTRVYPGHGMINPVAGDRFLIIEDIGDTGTEEGTQAWGTFTAAANDIIEYDGSNWHVIFDAVQDRNNHIYQTNIYTNIRVQYLWNGVSWIKSFEGDYGPGQWRITL